MGRGDKAVSTKSLSMSPPLDKLRHLTFLPIIGNRYSTKPDRNDSFWSENFIISSSFKRPRAF